MNLQHDEDLLDAAENSGLGVTWLELAAIAAVVVFGVAVTIAAVVLW